MKTIESLPPTWKDQKASVSYNLGLAHARYGDLDEAKKILSNIQSDSAHPVRRKAESLVKRINRCYEKNERLVLSDEREEENLDDTKWVVVDLDNPDFEVEEDDDYIDGLVTKLEVKRGDVCCHLLFYDIEDSGAKVRGLFDNQPAFRARSAIEREETNQVQHGSAKAS